MKNIRLFIWARIFLERDAFSPVVFPTRRRFSQLNEKSKLSYDQLPRQPTNSINLFPYKSTEWPSATLAISRYIKCIIYTAFTFLQSTKCNESPWKIAPRQHFHLLRAIILTLESVFYVDYNLIQWNLHVFTILTQRKDFPGSRLSWQKQQL